MLFNKKRGFVGLLSAVLLQLQMGASWAWVDVHAPAATRTSTGVVRDAGLFQTNVTLLGEKIAAQRFRGFGKDEQIQDALPAILGRRWTIRWGGVDPRMSVTWNSHGKTRAEMLDHLGKLYGIVIGIDWKNRLVTVENKGYKGSYVSLSDRLGRVREYRTLTALSLKENVLRWSRMGEPWHVIWKSRWNARIPVEESFGTDFRQALIRIVAAANTNGGSHYVIDFYPNHVVVVGDRQ